MYQFQTIQTSETKICICADFWYNQFTLLIVILPVCFHMKEHVVQVPHESWVPFLPALIRVAQMHRFVIKNHSWNLIIKNYFFMCIWYLWPIC